MMGMKFFSGYLTEYMRSIDNLFVFIMIFTMMKVREDVQPMLKFGILLSIIFRTLFILVGMSLINRFLNGRFTSSGLSWDCNGS